MKKLGLGMILVLTSMSGMAYEQQGNRLGFGITHSQVEQLGHTYKANAVNVDWGYDFNQVFSLNAGGVFHTTEDVYGNKPITGYVEVEFGHVFDVGSGFHVKPYVAGGLAMTTREKEIETPDSSGEHLQNVQAGVSVAAGVRVVASSGIYIDTRIGRVNFDKVREEKAVNLSIGYKF